MNISLIILLLTAYLYSQKNKVVVSYLKDGDSFVDTKGRQYRFYLLDAPEKGSSFSDLSENFLRKKILKKKIKIKFIKKDRYGRNVVEVFRGWENIGLTMVKNGMAFIDYRFFNGNDVYRSAERRAKMKKKGVWSKSVVKPWSYRRMFK